MTRVFLAATILLALCSPSWAEVVSLGTSGDGGKWSIDTKQIERHQYKTVKAGEVLQTIQPKPFRQVWVQATSPDGSNVSQHLWAFNCAGRAAELAAVVDGDPKGSFDVTARVLSGTIDPYMQAIPPVSFFKAAERIVCK